MLKRYTGKLYCFSPPVMLATFLLEFGLVLYTVWRYKLTPVSRLVVAMLVGLGTFQLAEYMVCGGLGWTGSEWSRLAYMSITLLPALGIHLISTIAGKQPTLLISAAYLSCAAFMVFFAFAPGAINLQECRPNYAVFNLQGANLLIYGVYYYGWLLASCYLAWHWAKHATINKARALYAMMIGYILFMAPTTTLNLLDPSTTSGIPSIMCGFAVLLAVVMVGFVLPQSAKLRVPARRQPLKRKHS